jgi:integrase
LPLPATVASVSHFITLLAANNKHNLTTAAFAAIKFYHTRNNMPSPSSAFLQLLVDGAARIAVQHKAVNAPKDALPVQVLRDWINSPHRSTALIHARDAALVAVGLRTMRRPAELAALDLDDVSFTTDNTMVIRIKSAKNDQFHHGMFVHVDAVLDSITCPVLIMKDYLQLRGNHSGPLFLSVNGCRMSVSSISCVVKKMASSSNVSGDFSGRSLRVGGASAALAAGWSQEQIQSVGGWKSDVVARYYRTKPLARRGASKALGF